MEISQLKETMTAQEVAEYLGVTRQTIYKWANYAGLPNKQMCGRVRLFSRSQIDEWVKSNKVGASNE
ncbi:helix-turn-helix domain-containing protein [Listeria monocytogenes]|uniref:helix-turn-helix domain-containing protein n=1 Tax=Listeria TaxID=1637 RepID=UPI00086C578D|nr:MULTISPECIES: helix-turn-helix domain-containing protein [Listeria]EAC2891904.1 DNA-binding protein [Listeria monocytogenes]EAE0202332.1 DNA-binding protein [Listeria monocytogenes]EAE9689094.1 DNA-binding protein [Listeria monocytogenes]EAE9692154.1 DNA-binding protein [Listeria monocytogenes]EAE9694105.1 DNA-binding protein [Listeria monocytogenes]